MAAPDEILRERTLWACISVIVGLADDGPELATDARRFARLEAACHTFGIGPQDFDAVARRMDFHYYRPMDCYLSREGLAEARRADAITAAWAVGSGTLH